jgi:outer membrane lipoprotein-sorting protein
MKAPLSPFSSRTTRRPIFVALLLMLLPVFSHAADWDIDELMRSMAQTRSGHVRFVERKTIAMLDKPVESSGELFYSAPDHLEKRTLKPNAETMLVDGNTLVIERAHKKHFLQLPEYPELAVFIDCIRGTLAGDRKALERHYKLDLSGSAEHWILQLLPMDEKMQAVVNHIRITGRRDTVRSIEIIQADGDRSLMLIEDLAQP